MARTVLLRAPCGSCSAGWAVQAARWRDRRARPVMRDVPEPLGHRVGLVVLAAHPQQVDVPGRVDQVLRATHALIAALEQLPPCRVRSASPSPGRRPTDDERGVDLVALHRRHALVRRRGVVEQLRAGHHDGMQRPRPRLADERDPALQMPRRAGERRHLEAHPSQAIRSSPTRTSRRRGAPRCPASAHRAARGTSRPAPRMQSHGERWSTSTGAHASRGGAHPREPAGPAEHVRPCRHRRG